MSGTEGLRQLVEERTRLLADNERMRARVIELEAEVAVLRGTLARYDATDDGPVTLIEVPPNAPR